MKIPAAAATALVLACSAGVPPAASAKPAGGTSHARAADGGRPRRPACGRAAVTTPDAEVVLTPHPSTYLRPADLPASFDWRFYRNTSRADAAAAATSTTNNNITPQNLCNRAPTQQVPNVCGSCWAEAATGALSDRYTIATGGALRLQLAPQVLLNFAGKLTGGSCLGGSALDAYNFVHRFGITDDTCAPFVGMNFAWGFHWAESEVLADVQDHMCKVCSWDGNCDWVPKNDSSGAGVVHHYGADEFGSVPLGEHAMMAEIFARGPIACSIDSDPDAFDLYTGGVIRSSRIHPPSNDTDHVIVLTGWGEEPPSLAAARGAASRGSGSSGGGGEDEPLKYWVGRNSYGSRWGEGAGGGWFRVQRGNNTLAVEQSHCAFAVPAAADVARAAAQAAAVATPPPTAKEL